MLRVKVCGLTHFEDVLAALRCGAWALGFNFYPGSPRYVTAVQVREWIKVLPKKIMTVGIVVNASPEEVLALQQESGVDYMQLHGDEKTELYKGSLIKTVRLKEDLQNTFLNTEYLLVDAYSESCFGGSGQIADWNLAAQLAKQHPTILAGGLNASNLEAAVNTVQPFAVDLCSGVEENPGKKSIRKLEAFFQIAKTIRGVKPC